MIPNHKIADACSEFCFSADTGALWYCVPVSVARTTVIGYTNFPNRQTKEPQMNPRPTFDGDLYTLTHLIDFRYKLEKWGADAEREIAKLRVMLAQHAEVSGRHQRQVAELKNNLAARNEQVEHYESVFHNYEAKLKSERSKTLPWEALVTERNLTINRQRDEIESLHKTIYGLEQELKNAGKEAKQWEEWSKWCLSTRPVMPVGVKVKYKPWWVLLLELLGWRETRYEVTYEFKVKEMPPQHHNCKSRMNATFLSIDCTTLPPTGNR